MFATMTANARSLRQAMSLSVAMCLLFSGLANAEEARFSSMKEAMKGLAQDIHRRMIAKGGESIAIKQFEGPAGASGSSGIAKALEEQLKAENVKVEKPSAGIWSIGGDFSVEKSEATGLLDVRIESK